MNKDCVIGISLTRKERQAIVAAARAKCLSITAYLRTKLALVLAEDGVQLDLPKPTKPQPELKRFQQMSFMMPSKTVFSRPTKLPYNVTSLLMNDPPLERSALGKHRNKVR